MISIDYKIEERNYISQFATALISIQDPKPIILKVDSPSSVHPPLALDTQHFKTILTNAFKSKKYGLF